MVKLYGFLSFGVSLCCAACPGQSGGKSSVSFDVCRVARNRFLVTLDGVVIDFSRKHTAGVGCKSGTLPVDRHASEFSCLLALLRRFCTLALLGENASERDVRSRLFWHYFDGFLERI